MKARNFVNLILTWKEKSINLLIWNFGSPHLNKFVFLKLCTSVELVKPRLSHFIKLLKFEILHIFLLILLSYVIFPYYRNNDDISLSFLSVRDYFNLFYLNVPHFPTLMDDVWKKILLGGSSLAGKSLKSEQKIFFHSTMMIGIFTMIPFNGFYITNNIFVMFFVSDFEEFNVIITFSYIVLISRFKQSRSRVFQLELGTIIGSILLTSHQLSL